MPTLSRNARVLRYLLEVAPQLNTTLLLKFAYLADCEARKHLGRQISEFRYIRWDHGPFDKALYGAISELVDSGYVEKCTIRFPDLKQGSYFRRINKPIDYEFGLADAAVLEYVAKTYMNRTARRVCDDVVYETEPMKAEVDFGKELPMDILNNKERTLSGFDLELLLRSEASVVAGRYRPLSEAIDELLASDHP